jgi:hypothetical protein
MRESLLSFFIFSFKPFKDLSATLTYMHMQLVTRPSGSVVLGPTPQQILLINQLNHDPVGRPITRLDKG